MPYRQYHSYNTATGADDFREGIEYCADENITVFAPFAVTSGHEWLVKTILEHTWGLGIVSDPLHPDDPAPADGADAVPPAPSAVESVDRRWLGRKPSRRHQQ